MIIAGKSFVQAQFLSLAYIYMAYICLQRQIFKDDIQSNLRMCGKYCLWGAQTNHINVNDMKYLCHY
jgi:hypothetical protein